MSVGADIAASKQISLATYRKDGTAVSTPVWQVTEGDRMIVISEERAWKVRRIRNNPRVEVTACDLRGKVAEGARPVSGTARILDERESLAARELVARRYLLSRVGNWFARVLRVKRKPIVGIEIVF